MATKLKPENKNKGGRPRVDLEEEVFSGWDQLDQLIIWSTQEYCAEKLGISVDTLTRRIKEKHSVGFAEYKRQRQEPMRINLLKKQYDTAMNGNVAMLIWLGKQHLGQSEKVQTKNEHSSPDGSFKIEMNKEEKLEMLEKYKNSISEKE